MGCNCKRGVELEEKYGENVEETPIEKGLRLLYKVAVFALVLVLGIVVSPIAIIYVLYRMVFGDGGVKIPRKIMEMASKG